MLERRTVEMTWGETIMNNSKLTEKDIKGEAVSPSRPLICSACFDFHEHFLWLLGKALDKTIQPHEIAVLYLMVSGSFK